MKQLVIINKIMVIASYLFGYSFFNKILGIKNTLITLSVGRKLKYIGEKTSFCYPLIISDAKYISIGNNVVIGSNARIRAIDYYENTHFEPLILIKDNVIINRNCHIAAIQRVEIGENVLIASGVYISDHFHGDTNSYDDIEIPPGKRDLFSKGIIVIEQNVWIGQNVSILPNVIIGKNSIIGANSVVTHNIPPYSVAVGVPAQVIKRLK